MRPVPVQQRLDRLWVELSRSDPNWFRNPRIRRAVTRDDPAAFAALYLRNHLKGPETGDVVSYAGFHADWYEDMGQWVEPISQPREWRHIYVAPRASGKSTHWFLIAPMWALAHKHASFAAAFADASTQSEAHLATFRRELRTNTYLMTDYPDLCAPLGSDNQHTYQAKSGAVFAARGVDAASLGLKIGERRPDLLILDDVEPGGSVYSAYQAEKRLATLTDVILPLNDQARVAVVGTVTLTGSIIHQAVKHAAEPARWVDEERFVVRHSLPMVDGESVWPQRWSTEYLHSIENTRQYALNFLNQPTPLDGEYWQPEDFIIGDLASVSRRIIAIDPAVTTARTSDETGIAVVGYSHAARKCVVNEAFGVRMKGEPLRKRILDLLSRYPDCAEVLVERNQGGEMMAEAVFHGFPVPVRTVHSSERKEIRVERALSYYRRGAVLHATRLPALEAQCLEFPRGIHDDIVDAASLALDYLALPKKPSLRTAVR